MDIEGQLAGPAISACLKAPKGLSIKLVPENGP